MNRTEQLGPGGMAQRSQAAHALSYSLQGYPVLDGQHQSRTHPAKCGRAGSGLDRPMLVHGQSLLIALPLPTFAQGTQDPDAAPARFFPQLRYGQLVHTLDDGCLRQFALDDHVL